MVTLVNVKIPPNQFELGRILSPEEDSTIDLWTGVPLGRNPIPYFRLYEGDAGTFGDAVGLRSEVNDIHVMNQTGNETLYEWEWEMSDDGFFSCVRDLGGHILNATGTSDSWTFKMQFPTHDAVSDFQLYCTTEKINTDIGAIYNSIKSDGGPWFGLSAEQRNALSIAVDKGYYSIPRECHTQELAEYFDISDQAMSERLRRGINKLVTNTILFPHEEDGR